MSQIVFTLPTNPNGAAIWPFIWYPNYNTIIQGSINFVGENRISTTQYPIWTAEIDLAYVRDDVVNSALEAFLGLFMQMRGQADSFLFSHPDPKFNTVTQNSFGIGDGTAVVFQITRTFGGGIDLVQNFNGTPLIYIGGVASGPSNWSIDSNGIITFNSAPALGSVLTWSGSFYFRCRFDEDSLSGLKKFAPGLWDDPKVKFVSLITG